MGRRAGVTPDEIRDALLRAAAVVFARDGFEGASVADITAEAGTSSGPIYAHFGGKAELLAAALTSSTDHALDQVLGSVDPDVHPDAANVLAALGAALAHTGKGGGSLLVESVVAARRDETVAELVTERFTEREEHIRGFVRHGQKAGDIDERVSPEAVARFSMVVALGSLLLSSLELEPVDPDDWARLIGGVTKGMRSR